MPEWAAVILLVIAFLVFAVMFWPVREKKETPETVQEADREEIRKLLGEMAVLREEANYWYAGWETCRMAKGELELVLEQQDRNMKKLTTQIAELEEALRRIGNRAKHVASGELKVSAYSMADYDIEVADTALAGKEK